MNQNETKTAAQRKSEEKATLVKGVKETTQEEMKERTENKTSLSSIVYTSNCRGIWRGRVV